MEPSFCLGGRGGCLPLAVRAKESKQREDEEVEEEEEVIPRWKSQFLPLNPEGLLERGVFGEQGSWAVESGRPRQLEASFLVGSQVFMALQMAGMQVWVRYRTLGSAAGPWLGRLFGMCLLPFKATFGLTCCLPSSSSPSTLPPTPWQPEPVPGNFWSKVRSPRTWRNNRSSITLFICLIMFLLSLLMNCVFCSLRSSDSTSRVWGYFFQTEPSEMFPTLQAMWPPEFRCRLPSEAISSWREGQCFFTIVFPKPAWDSICFNPYG